MLVFQTCTIIKPRSYRVIKSHRIIEQCKLEGSCRGHLIQSLWNDPGHLQLEQVTQSPIQPVLVYFWGWVLYLFQCFTTL